MFFSRYVLMDKFNSIRTISRSTKKHFSGIKGTVQRKLTVVLSDINWKLMISSIVAEYFF
jgi:hypothetical protein